MQCASAVYLVAIIPYFILFLLLKFSVDCCKYNVVDANMSCYSNFTAWTSSGYGSEDGKALYLNLQEIACSNGYALNYFALQTDQDENHTDLINEDPTYTGLVRYHYKCCRLNYRD